MTEKKLIFPGPIEEWIFEGNEIDDVPIEKAAEAPDNLVERTVSETYKAIDLDSERFPHLYKK